jgi:hypothetical protein
VFDPPHVVSLPEHEHDVAGLQDQMLGGLGGWRRRQRQRFDVRLGAPHRQMVTTLCTGDRGGEQFLLSRHSDEFNSLRCRGVARRMREG